jgi:hypothetical protein
MRQSAATIILFPTPEPVPCTIIFFAIYFIPSLQSLEVIIIT